MIIKKGNGKEILMFTLANVDAKMLCLHGKPAGSRVQVPTYGCRTPVRYNYCRQPSTCHFNVYSNDRHKDIYCKAVKTFLATNQKLPTCCAETAGSTVRNYAKMKVVNDKEKGSFGRLYFVCSKFKNKCNYFEWGDQVIVEKPLCKHGNSPLCKHGNSSRLMTVKKEGPNKGRKFFCCAERKENSCKFFQWFEDQEELADGE